MVLKIGCFWKGGLCKKSAWKSTEKNGFDSNHLKPIITIAVNTGMRKGEILNLKWDDIDFDQKIITIRNSKSGDGGGNSHKLVTKRKSATK